MKGDYHITEEDGEEAKKISQEGFDKELAAKGVGNKLMALRMKQGLSAKKELFFTYQGNVIDEKKVPDQPTRKQFLELLMKNQGMISDKHEIDVGETTIRYFKHIQVKE